MTVPIFSVVLVSASILSGLLILLSLPSFDLGFLAWVGLSPLFFALRQRGPLTASALGFLFGCVFGAGTFYWLNVLPFVTPLRFLLMIAAGSIFYLVFGLLYNLTTRASTSWAIVGGPAAWVVLEYARANADFLSLPWNFLAHSQYRYLSLIQIVDVTGAYGVSFLIAMVNQLLSQIPDLLIGRERGRVRAVRIVGSLWAIHLSLVMTVLAGTLLYGWHRLAAPEHGQHLRVALVQGNLRPRNGMSSRDQMEHLRTYERLTRQAARENPDIIVWPSSSLPAPFELWTVRLYVNWMASQVGTYLLVGGAGGDKLAPAKDGYVPYSNSEILISPSGHVEGQYNKMHLTPFLETIPHYGTFKWPHFITSLERGYIPGETFTLFEVSGARFGAPICWESAFPELFRRFVLAGAHFMVSATNEGGFGATSAPYQALAMVVFRAIENRVMIARAATTGVSAFVDAKGNIVARISDDHGKDLFVSGVSVRDVRLANNKTFYTLYGDIFAQSLVGIVSLIISTSVVTWRARSRRLSHSAGPEPSTSGPP